MFRHNFGGIGHGNWEHGVFEGMELTGGLWSSLLTLAFGEMVYIAHNGMLVDGHTNAFLPNDACFMWWACEVREAESCSDE